MKDTVGFARYGICVVSDHFYSGCTCSRIWNSSFSARAMHIGTLERLSWSLSDMVYS